MEREISKPAQNSGGEVKGVLIYMRKKPKPPIRGTQPVPSLSTRIWGKQKNNAMKRTVF